VSLSFCVYFAHFDCPPSPRNYQKTLSLFTSDSFGSQTPFFLCHIPQENGIVWEIVLHSGCPVWLQCCQHKAFYGEVVSHDIDVGMVLPLACHRRTNQHARGPQQARNSVWHAFPLRALDMFSPPFNRSSLYFHIDFVYIHSSNSHAKIRGLSWKSVVTLITETSSWPRSSYFYSYSERF